VDGAEPVLSTRAASTLDQLADPVASDTDEEVELNERRAYWMDKIADLTGPIPLRLPPEREIYHRIQLMDPKLELRHRMPKCAEAYQPQLLEKIRRYVSAGWWTPTSTSSAPPMMVIPKKDGSIRTVIDARQRNDNTVKDVTPLPDQDLIRHAVTTGKYRSKLDMKDAYEQILVHPDDVEKTAFSTI
jgi:hypothetical protein